MPCFIGEFSIYECYQSNSLTIGELNRSPLKSGGRKHHSLVRSCGLDLHCKSHNIVAFDGPSVTLTLDDNLDYSSSEQRELNYDIYLVITAVTLNLLPMA